VQQAWGPPRPYGMDRVRIGGWLSVAILASGIVGCSPTGATVSPRNSSGPSTPAQPSAEPTAAASFATAAASPVEALSELEVVCDGTHTDIPTPLVRTQADGIHIHFANTSGRTLDVAIEEASGAALLGEAIPGVGGTHVYTFGTGSYQLTCGETLSTFAVVDPDRLYTPSELRCAGQSSSTVDYGEAARGPRGSLLDIARTELRGLEPGDVVEHAGYLHAAGNQLVRIVRHGQVVAVLEYADDGHGGWLIGGTRTCSDSHVTTVSPTG
jgi:hypothetical protein